MRRFLKYIIALLLVGGFSLTTTVETQHKAVFAQGPVIDIPNLGINITHLLEELVRLGDNVNNVTSGLANNATVETIKSIVKGIQEISEIMQLIGMGIDQASLIYQLCIQIGDDIIFMKEFNEQLKEFQASLEDNFMEKTLSSLNLVSSYITMTNVVVSTTANQINYILKKVMDHNKKAIDGKSTSDWTAKEILQMSSTLTNTFFSEYYALRSLYMNRYFVMYRRMSRHCIALGNEKALKILF